MVSVLSGLQQVNTGGLKGWKISVATDHYKGLLVIR